MLQAEVFVARQPIFNRLEQVYAYELLFRSSWSNFFDAPNADQPSLKVIADSFFLIGIDAITRGKPAFINFTRDTLVKGYATILPRDMLVVEIQEDVPPDDEVVAACVALKRAGYRLALDNMVLADPRNPLGKLVDFIKVDFSTIPPDERRQFARQFGDHHLQLIASRVETAEEFGEAITHGYSLMQGYYFCRPVVIRGADVPGFKLNYLRLLQEINRPSLDLSTIEEIFKREVALSYKLLRYINSAAFGLRNRITSVRQALVLLGQKGLRRWASVATLTGLGLDQPPEVVVTSVLRAKLCESLAPKLKLEARQHDLFLMGLFSLLDVIVGRPIAEVVAELPIADDVKAALAGEANALRPILELVIAYERGDWAMLARRAADLELPEADLPNLYREAVRWAAFTDDTDDGPAAQERPPSRTIS